MTQALDIFLDHLTTNGLEFYRSFYSEYRAFVVRNDDPEGRGRIQVSAPPFGDGEALDIWIDPSFDGTGPNRGQFWPPEINDVVWVRFDRGRNDAPLTYRGGWHGKTNIPKEFLSSSVPQAKNKVPTRRGIVTRMGHMIIFTEEAGKESIRILRHIPAPGDPALTDRSKSANRATGKWSTFLMEPNGDVRISNDNGSFLHLDAVHKEAKLIDEHGNSLTLSDAGVKLIDKDGNIIAIDGGKVNIISNGDVTVTAPTFSAVTGGTNLSQGASQSLVLGEIYTLARSQMNILLSIAHSLVGAHLTGEGAAATALIPTLNALSLAGPVAPLAAALIPFFTAIGPTAAAAGAPSIQAGTGITQFEAQSLAYLSKVTKTA